MATKTKTITKQIAVFVQEDGTSRINPVVTALGALEAAREALSQCLEYDSLADQVQKIQQDLINKVEVAGEISIG